MTINFPHRRIKSILKQLLEAGLAAADPINAVRKVLQPKGQTLWVGNRRYNLTNFRRVVCVGAGKASGKMAIAVEQQLGHRLEGGLVIVTDGCGSPTTSVRIQEAGHPFPDKRSQRAGRHILKIARSLKDQDLLLFLLSGGASSLLHAPAPPLQLGDIQKTTRLLLQSGATIQEINVIRKHLSAIKGGRLAEATSATIIGLLLSDVLGDDVGTIGSGPLSPDPSTFQDAYMILKVYGLWNHLPPSVRNHLQQGQRGRVQETPKPGSPVFRRTYQHLVGNNRLIVDSLAKKAKGMGLRTVILTTTLTGEAREAGKFIGAIAKEIHYSGSPIRRPACLICGGELTVTVRGNGKGGRAQEFALSAAQVIAGLPNLFVAGFGTDGKDGPTEIAGAVVDGDTLTRANQHQMNAAKSLCPNDSYAFFKKVGGHIVTGPTGTNLNDIYLVLAL